MGTCGLDPGVDPLELDDEDVEDELVSCDVDACLDVSASGSI